MATRWDLTTMSAAAALTLNHWIKQLVATACGLAFGAYAVTGWQPIVVFAAFMVTCSFLTMHFSPSVDVLSVDDQSELLKEGAPTAVGLFFLVWIVTYTLIHASAADSV